MDSLEPKEKESMYQACIQKSTRSSDVRYSHIAISDLGPQGTRPSETLATGLPAPLKLNPLSKIGLRFCRPGVCLKPLCDDAKSQRVFKV